MKHGNQLVICFAILLSSALMAEVPQLISYQGRLTDPSNDPVSDGNYEITFSIYDVETGGTSFWAETLSTVGVQNGLFNVVLGATTPLGGPSASLSKMHSKMGATQSIWLGIKVGVDPELSPRSQFLSVLFAFNADWADTAKFTYNSQNATHADTAFYTNGAHWSDSSDFAFSSGWADTSDHAKSIADETVGSASVIDGSIALADIGPNGAADGQILKWNNTLSSWETADETVGSGNITAVNAGSGLTGGGISGDVVLGISNNGVNSTHIQDAGIQSQDLSSFGATDGQMLKWNNSLSTWEPVAEAGDISSVTAGSGLTGGGTSGDVSLNIQTGGVNSSHIQDGAIISADIGDIQVTNSKIGGNAVTTDKIADATIIDGDVSGSAAIAAYKINGVAATLSGINVFTALNLFNDDVTLAGALSTFNGRVGIGTSSPDIDARLEVVSSSKYAGLFTASATSASTKVVNAEYIGAAADAIAVYGRSVPFDGYGFGGYFVGGKKGMYAEVLATGSQVYYGVQGLTTGGTGSNYGVKGEGSGGTNNYGVSGYANGSSFNAGILGSVGTSGLINYAGYFSGDVNVTGTLSKGAGSFKIDHPLDPANKYLYHSFVESPDMMNVYNGNITLDANGDATVTLPDYFGALNKDFRYQLTAIGAPGPNLYISEKISANSFRISGGASGMEVSWQVTGIRKDAYAEANRIEVEVDKLEADRGLYVHPKAIGLDETKSVDYKHHPKDDKAER